MRSLMPLIALLGFACGDKAIEEDDTDTSGGSSDTDDTDDGTCTADSQCASYEICEGDACVDGDRNNSVAEAEAILWEDTTRGYINPDEDVDYYSFNSDGGEFVRVTTVTDDESADTVVVIRDADGKVVAWSDNYPNGSAVSNYDSVVYAYLADAGAYIVSVEDIGTYYSGGTPMGGSFYSYDLMVEEWSNVTDDTDDVDNPGMSFDISSANSWTAVGVLLDDTADADYIEVTFPWSGAGLLIDGMQDLGNSEATPLVRILDASGDVLSAKASVGPDGPVFYPSMTEADYMVEVSDEDGGGGDDYWFFLFFNAGEEDSAFPEEEEDNGADHLANTIALEEFENSSGNLFSRGYVQGFSDSADDEDWFLIEAPYEETWLIACMNSALWGSSYAPTLEIYDAGGVLLGSDEGSITANPNANIENVEATQATYYLRVVAPEGAEGGPDHWWRTIIYAASFEVSDYASGGYSCP